MSLHYVPEITNGVLLSRLGDVHRAATVQHTSCGERIPARHAPVSHVAAIVHKLPLCHVCYPNHHGPGGRYAAHR